MTRFNFSTLATLSFISLSLMVACSSTSDDPKPSVIAVGGESGTGGNSSGGNGGASSGGTATGASNSGGTNTGGSGGVIQNGGQGGSAVDCIDAVKGCYKCEPKKTAEFLDHCTNGACIKYDNSKLTKLVGGKVPPLP